MCVLSKPKLLRAASWLGLPGPGPRVSPLAAQTREPRKKRVMAQGSGFTLSQLGHSQTRFLVRSRTTSSLSESGSGTQQTQVGFRTSGVMAPSLAFQGRPQTTSRGRLLAPPANLDAEAFRVLRCARARRRPAIRHKATCRVVERPDRCPSRLRRGSA